MFHGLLMVCSPELIHYTWDAWRNEAWLIVKLPDILRACIKPRHIISHNSQICGKWHREWINYASVCALESLTTLRDISLATEELEWALYKISEFVPVRRWKFCTTSPRTRLFCTSYALYKKWRLKFLMYQYNALSFCTCTENCNQLKRIGTIKFNKLRIYIKYMTSIKVESAYHFWVMP